MTSMDAALRIFLLLGAIQVCIIAFRTVDIIVMKEGSKYYKKSYRHSFATNVSDAAAIIVVCAAVFLLAKIEIHLGYKALVLAAVILLSLLMVRSAERVT